MARNHARILTSIWNDEDFLALDGGAQRLYLMLLSQQNLSHAGLLPLTVKRWASKAPDTTVSQVERWLADLEAARFVVIDDVTEELLIRSLIRGDEVWKHWKVMTAAANDVDAIASPRLQFVMAVEVARMLAIPEVPAASRPLLERLRDALPNPTDTQPEPDPRDKGQGKVTVGTTDDLPLPLPHSPAPAPSAIAEEPQDDPTGALIREHAAAYAQPPPPSALIPVKREVMRLVSERVEPDRIRAGLARMRERRLAASLLPQLVSEATPTTRPSTTDQRVANGLALVARYEEAGE